MHGRSARSTKGTGSQTSWLELGTPGLNRTACELEWARPRPEEGEATPLPCAVRLCGLPFERTSIMPRQSFPQQRNPQVEPEGDRNQYGWRACIVGS